MIFWNSFLHGCAIFIICSNRTAWNRSDPDLYPETQQNFLATGLIPICKSYLYQFCSSVSFLQNPKTWYSYRSDTDMCRYCPNATAVLIQFRKYALFSNELYRIRKILAVYIQNTNRLFVGTAHA